VYFQIKNAEQKELSLKNASKELKSDEANSSSDNGLHSLPASIPQVA